jgi:hypothetical protein
LQQVILWESNFAEVGFYLWNSMILQEKDDFETATSEFGIHAEDLHICRLAALEKA